MFLVFLLSFTLFLYALFKLLSSPKPYSSNLLLISIGPSHFCEKARWTLDLFQLPYHEERYVPIFHLLRTVPLGGRGTPALLDGQTYIQESSIIMQHLQTGYTSGGVVRKITDQKGTEHNVQVSLFPSDKQELQTVLDLENRFGRTLGKAVRVFAYFYLLPLPEISIQILSTPGVRPFDRLVLPLIYPVFRFLLKKGLSITPENNRRSIASVNECFDEVSRLLESRYGPADEQEGITKFLLGNTISAADITFAALGSLAVMPDNYGYPVVKEEIIRKQISPEYWTHVDGWRGTRAGRYILNFYKFHRPTPKGTLSL